jgi:RNA polymerase sigma factor
MENEPLSERHLVLQTREDLAARLELAQTDKHSLNTLIHDYMPFIKKCLSTVFFKADERRNNTTEAMLAFIHSVKTYNPENGAFIPYAQTVIRNRLINAALKEAAIKKTFFALSISKDENGTDGQWEPEAARRQYEIAEEHKNLKMEIQAINREFGRWGFELLDLVKTCPKQERSRQTCGTIARKALENSKIIGEMARTHTLPIKQLAALSCYPEKTLEKYRRYIVALIVIMEGDYPYLRSFLPPFGETEMSGASGELFINIVFLFLLEGKI